MSEQFQGTTIIDLESVVDKHFYRGQKFAGTANAPLGAESSHGNSKAIAASDEGEQQSSAGGRCSPDSEGSTELLSNQGAVPFRAGTHHPR